MTGTRNRARLLGMAVALAATMGTAHAERAYVPVESRLTAGQMQATGLDQLSAEQLALLNQLLREDQDEVVAETVREKRRDETAPVASAIRGEVRGWEKGTVFELENGQRWRVADGEYVGTRAFANPKATVRPGMFSSWYLHIDGIGVAAKVKRVDF